ncbi:uncharacterized protein TNCV_4088351 [Trichonephila clavipes]|nr:uncharacterized protein TNCV_4088351 [Trichonephila clavipes]
MEARWSALQVARQVGRSDLTARSCSDQWTEETSFTRGPGSERPRQISRREDHHIIQHARVEPTASSAAVQTHVAPSQWAFVSSHSSQECCSTSGIAVPITCVVLDALPSTPPFEVVPRTMRLAFQRNGTKLSSATNLDSI